MFDKFCRYAAFDGVGLAASGCDTQSAAFACSWEQKNMIELDNEFLLLIP